MPFKSQAQRRFMYARHPEMAKEWEKKTPKGKKLPGKVKKEGTELPMDDELKEGIRDYVSKMRGKWAKSRKVYQHIKKSGLSGRTPEEAATFMKKAALYRRGRATAAIVGGAAAAGGSLYLAKKLIARHKRKQKEEKAKLAKMSPLERQLLKDKNRRRRWAAIGGGLGAAAGAGLTGLEIQAALVQQGMLPADAKRYWKAMPGKQKWGMRAISGAGYGTMGAIQGYLVAKQKEQVERQKRIEKSLRKRGRYESVDDMIDSLLHEEMQDEG